MAQMNREARQARAVFEAGEGQFVSNDDAQARKRDGQGMSMKQCDAEQSQRKQDEIDRNTEEENGIGQCSSNAFDGTPNLL